jgi:L-fuculose-phosphate aldolase
VELAQGISILERLGIIDFNGHFSARLADGTIVVNSGKSVRSAISVADFVVVTPDGTCAGGQEKPPAELPLHLAIYEARPDVGAIAHGHPKWSTLLSTSGLPYAVTLAQGALLGDVPVYSSPRSVNNPGTAGEVAATLGSGSAVLLRAHGSVVAAADILEATVLAVYLEMNAERQVGAALLGNAHAFSAEEIAAFRAGLRKRSLFEKCWNYYLVKFGLAGSSQ